MQEISHKIPTTGELCEKFAAWILENPDAGFAGGIEIVRNAMLKASRGGTTALVRVVEPVTDEQFEAAIVIQSRWLMEHPEIHELVARKQTATNIAIELGEP